MVERTLDIENPEQFNPWVYRSIELFHQTNYLDQVAEVYPLEIATPERLESTLRRQIIMAHQSQNTTRLLQLLKSVDKFPYEDPIWYMIKNIDGCLEPKFPKYSDTSLSQRDPIGALVSLNLGRK